MASLYLTDDLADARPGARVEVTGDEARHALQVARIRPGERIAVGDGRGTLVRGAVVASEPGVLAVEVDEVSHEPAPAPAALAGAIEGIPLRRVAEPDELAACALFLASDEASFVTGAMLVADGGQTIQ